MNLDYDSFNVESMLNPQGLTLDGIVSPQMPATSPTVSPAIPDDTYGDDDFRKLKPVRCPQMMLESHRMQLYDAVHGFSPVLPLFVFPSRLAIARYVSGYVDGFSHHHPFIHIPTLQLVSYLQTPELILAILAIGAQYRYENKTAFSLYEASRAIVLERVRRGDLFCPHQDPVGEELSAHDWMHRIRTLLLLFVYTSWQNKPDLVLQAFEYQGVIARCLQWARNESDRRTKLFAWCLLNLHGLAFDTPPVLLSRELNMFLPSTCREWIARNQTEWKAARSHAPDKMMVKEAQASHLRTDGNAPPPPAASPMGNYILIHVLLQRIYLTQQLSHDPHVQSLLPSDIADLELALDRWRHSWRTSPESALDLHNPSRSLSFTSTALLGAARIRLHCNLGQWRDLQSCNPDIIAATLHEAPPPQRSPPGQKARLKDSGCGLCLLARPKL
ncbi:hypothetical protein BDW62DRAFT_204521 [Aspergillus aurantiobrunneus]